MLEQWNNFVVRLKEDITDLKSGAIGLVTADLPGEAFAVYFRVEDVPDHKICWYTFKDSNIKEKFEVLDRG